jgi:predicted kinase
MPNLIVVNGIPGTGKTTLAAKLSEDTGIPCLHKDSLKEFFYEKFDVDTREDSRLVGRVSARVLYIFAEEYLEADKSIILENAFFHDFAKPEFLQIVKNKPVNFIEVYCKTDAKVRRARYASREASGVRHKAHALGTDLSLLQDGDQEPNKTYAPLSIANLIEVDTTSFSEKEYGVVINKVKSHLQS